VVCAGNEAVEVEEEALKSSESHEIKDQESNDDGLMILSKVLRTEGNDLFVQNVEWVKSKCVDVMWARVPVARGACDVERMRSHLRATGERTGA
jgi:hypothetical protein